MSNLKSSLLSDSLLKNIDSVRGSFTIYDLSNTIITIVFFKYLADNIHVRKDIKLRSNIFDSFSSLKESFTFKTFRLKEYPYNSFIKAIRDLENDNDDFHEIFYSFDFNKFKDDKKYQEVLYQLLELVSEINFSESKVNFGNFIDNLFKGIINSQGKGIDAFQPKELSDLMLHFMPNRQNLSIYNPFSGYASLGLNLPEDSFYYAEENNFRICSYGQLRLVAHNVKNKYVLCGTDVFESWSTNDDSYDFIVTNPPFNLKLTEFDNEFDVDDRFYLKNNANSFIVSQCYKRLSPEIGKAVIVIPNSFLNSQNTKEKALREYLIKEGALEMVISFPGDVLNYTSIPFNLLVLSNSSEKKEPTFVDARECIQEVSRNNKILDVEKIYSILNSDNEFKKQVSVSEIIENDFNFIPARYLSAPSKIELEPGYQLIDFGSLVELSVRKSSPVPMGKYISIRDLSDNVLNYIKDFRDVITPDIPGAGTSFISLLPHNTLLVSIKGKSLKPTFYTESEANIYYPTNDIVAYKVKTELIDVEYLIFELGKEYVLQQIAAERTGTSIPYLSKDRLLSIGIKVPSLEQQKADVKLVRDTIVNAKLRELGLEEQFEQLKKDQIEDLSLKKHNIMQHLNNMQSSLDSLTLFMKQNNGVLEADNIIYPKFGTTVAKRFERLAESLKEAIYFVDNITNEISFSKAEFIDVNELLEICKEKGIQNEIFDFEPFFDRDTFIIDGEEQKPIIRFSKLDFFELYNNILENAIVHGFTDPTKKYQFRTELKYDQELNKVVISFLNNGKPFPKGIAERYQIKGEKAGATGNKGIGSWKVFEIAKHFGAEIKVHDLTGEDFPIRIDLLINLENE